MFPNVFAEVVSCEQFIEHIRLAAFVAIERFSLPIGKPKLNPFPVAFDVNDLPHNNRMHGSTINVFWFGHVSPFVPREPKRYADNGERFTTESAWPL
jgi:hypothetical protein